MSAERKLPDPDVLRAMLERGRTQREIAEEFGVTKQAVSFHVRRRNLAPAPPRHDAYIPWKIKLAHANSHTYHMLQAYARRSEGLALKPTSAKQLDGFLRVLNKLEAVVDYNDEDGFALVRRRPGIDKGCVRDPRVA